MSRLSYLKYTLIFIALVVPSTPAHPGEWRRSQSFQIQNDCLVAGGASTASDQFSIWGGSGLPGSGMCSSDNFVIWSGIGVFGKTAAHVEPSTGEAGPHEFRVFPNIPNPFERSTSFHYQLPAAADVSIKLYDPSGRVIRKLTPGHQAPGRHTTLWDGRDEEGHRVSAGIYFYRLLAGNQMRLGRVLLLK